MIAAKDPDLAYLGEVARQVVDGARVAAGAEIPGVGRNTTGHALRVPGATLTYYPAFWVRDAAMMLGAGLVPADEVEGWIRVVAATQPGPPGLNFPHGLHIPPYSIPDHITLKGEACWFPGAYAEQGTGAFGHLPPADDAFYFIQMVHELASLRGASTLKQTVGTAWGKPTIFECAARAFDSVAVSEAGLVVCEADPQRTRVDWGFCDSIRKTGETLFPSLLRWQAARRMERWARVLGDRPAADRYREAAKQIRAGIEGRLLEGGTLLSATGLGRKEDVWGMAFAVWLGALSPKTERAVALRLRDLLQAGEIVQDGQVRGLPKSAGAWEQALTAPGTYQNGGYWATPTGWLVVALRKVDRPAGDRVLRDYAAYVRTHRAEGAPFEWVNAEIGAKTNANYGSSAGLVYSALAGRRD